MRYYIVKDGTIICECCTREEAVNMIRQHQKTETHYLLKASYSIIKGEQEFVDYE